MNPRFRRTDLQQFVASLFAAAGLAQAESDLVASLLVRADSRAIPATASRAPHDYPPHGIAASVNSGYR